MKFKKLAEAIAKELDTRDKRFMFLKITFPEVIRGLNLEGSPEWVAIQIYEEFEKRNMLGSLMATMNSIFDLDLTIEY